MKIACVQFNSVWQDETANLKHLSVLFETQIAKDKPNVVLLPELFHSGFSMASQAIMQNRSGEVYRTLSKLAERHSLTIVAGVALQSDCLESTEVSVFNTALVFDPNGREQACYTKNQAFTLSGEHVHYQQDNKQVVFSIDGASCSVFICYDLRFPELFGKVAKRVEIIFVIANWPASRQSHWQTLLMARAIENQCFVVGVNRIGQDDYGIEYAGGSIVVNPMGEVLCQMDASFEYQSIEIDYLLTQVIRERFPFLNDRQI